MQDRLATGYASAFQCSPVVWVVCTAWLYLLGPTGQRAAHMLKVTVIAGIGSRKQSARTVAADQAWMHTSSGCWCTDMRAKPGMQNIGIAAKTRYEKDLCGEHRAVC